FANRVPNFTAFSSESSLNNSFDFGSNGLAFPEGYSLVGQNFEALFVGVFNAPTAGTYTFATGSDDGSMIFIDGQVVVDNNVALSFSERSGSTFLTQGGHEIVIAYYQLTAGYELYANVQLPGGTMQRLPNSLLDAIAPNNLQIGSLAGAGSLDLGLNKISVGAKNRDTTFTGVITGDRPSSLVKLGSGKLTLSQPRYLGTTAILMGTLQMGDGLSPLDSLPTAAIRVNG